MVILCSDLTNCPRKWHHGTEDQSSNRFSDSICGNFSPSPLIYNYVWLYNYNFTFTVFSRRLHLWGHWGLRGLDTVPNSGDMVMVRLEATTFLSPSMHPSHLHTCSYSVFWYEDMLDPWSCLLLYLPLDILDPRGLSSVRPCFLKYVHWHQSHQPVDPLRSGRLSCRRMCADPLSVRSPTVPGCCRRSRKKTKLSNTSKDPEGDWTQDLTVMQRCYQPVRCASHCHLNMFLKHGLWNEWAEGASRYFCSHALVGERWRGEQEQNGDVITAPYVHLIYSNLEGCVRHTHTNTHTRWLTGAEMRLWIAVGSPAFQITRPSNYTPLPPTPPPLGPPPAPEIYLFVCLFAWFKYLVEKILNFCPPVRVLIFS